jgi:hypothetical protein
MLLEQLKKTADLLTALQTQGLISGFALIGGLAVSTWSTPRATMDIDLLLLVQPEAHIRLVEALCAAGITAELFRGGFNDPVPYLVRGEHLDIILVTKKLESEAVKTSIHIKLADCSIPVVSPEYLILLKLQAGGPKDLMDIRELLASAPLDRQRLQELAHQYKLGKALEALLQK